MGPPDPILGVTEAFKRDTNPKKINLGVGAYRNNEGVPFVLPSVREAEARLLEAELDHEYAPIVGVADFIKVATELAYGKESPILAANRVAAVQALSGTGALRVAGEFIRRTLGEKAIFMPAPTWGNHIPIFQNSGLVVEKYRYYDPTTCGLDFSGLMEDIGNIPEGQIVLLHACAHNPTGVDPTPEQWAEISALVKRRNLLPLFDSAYQGFTSGDPEKDIQSVRKFLDDGHFVILCQSFAKNFGLYGHRVGTLSFVASDSEEASRILSQLKITIRPMYSNPPVQGARIVADILGDPSREAQWRSEVKGMAERITSMRSELVKKLADNGSTRNWSHITSQNGMFCFSGLSADNVAELADKYSIYLTSNGRISMAGVNPTNIDWLAQGIAAVTEK